MSDSAPITNASEGEHPNGILTLKAAATIDRGDILKFDDAGKVTPTTSPTDAAIAVALDGAETGDIVPVAILGSYAGTLLVKASGVITQGAQITAKGTGTLTATDVIIGRALDAASASGDLIECAHAVAHTK